jgi:hypothetical protein
MLHFGLGWVDHVDLNFAYLTQTIKVMYHSEITQTISQALFTGEQFNFEIYSTCWEWVAVRHSRMQFESWCMRLHRTAHIHFSRHKHALAQTPAHDKRQVHVCCCTDLMHTCTHAQTAPPTPRSPLHISIFTHTHTNMHFDAFSHKFNTQTHKHTCTNTHTHATPWVMNGQHATDSLN